MFHGNPMKEKMLLSSAKPNEIKPSQANSNLGFVYIVRACMCTKCTHANWAIRTHKHTCTRTHSRISHERKSEWIFITLDWNKHSIQFTYGKWGFLKTWKGHSSNYACDILLFLSILVQIIFIIQTQSAYSGAWKTVSSDFKWLSSKSILLLYHDGK